MGEGTQGQRSNEWLALAAAFQDAADVVLGREWVESELVEAEGVRYLTRLFSAGSHLQLEASDPACPVLVQGFDPWRNWALPNPDVLYLHAPLHGDFSYRISGTRGSAHIFDAEVRTGDWSTSVQNVFHSNFDVKPGDQLELILSREEHQGNWMSLPDGPCYLLLRQFFNDWETEGPASLVIERIGAEYPPPTFTPVDLIANFRSLATFLASNARLCSGVVGMYLANDPETVSFGQLAVGDDGEGESDVGVQDQLYGRGHYRCGPDDAVIVEAEMPECRYWSLHLASPFYEHRDYSLFRQNSINGHQAVLDDDGVFRAVISHRDPGVPNWLDAGGHTLGLISGRCNFAKSVPTARLRVVRFDDVRESLPATTPVVTPEERRRARDRRVLSLQRRLG